MQNKTAYIISRSPIEVGGRCKALPSDEIKIMLLLLKQVNYDQPQVAALPLIKQLEIDCNKLFNLDSITCISQENMQHLQHADTTSNFTCYKIVVSVEKGFDKESGGNVHITCSFKQQ